MPADKGFEQAALDRISQTIEPLADAMANTMGLPPGAQKYSESEQLTMWNASPIADPAQRAQTMTMLKQQGISNEQITDMVYPERRKLQTAGRPKVDDQLKYMREMKHLMDKKAAQLGAVSEPSPIDLAPPDMTMSAPAPAPEPTPIGGAMPAMPEPAAPASMLDMPMSQLMGG